MDRLLIRLTLVICIILLIASAMWWFGGSHAITRLLDLILFCGGLSFCLGLMTLFDVTNLKWKQFSSSPLGVIVGNKNKQNQDSTRVNYSYGFFLFIAGLIILVISLIRFVVV